MDLPGLLNDKSKKIKEKTSAISQWLLEGRLSTDQLIKYSQTANDSEKATCIEAIEYGTKTNPEIADDTVFTFVTKMLADKAPRVKWESARVIGNIAKLFPTKLSKTITNLLTNAEDDGTVVRWATAYALSEIVKLKTKHNKDLLLAIQTLHDREEDNAIRKKYLEAIKKAGK